MGCADITGTASDASATKASGLGRLGATLGEALAGGGDFGLVIDGLGRGANVGLL